MDVSVHFALVTSGLLLIGFVLSDFYQSRRERNIFLSRIRSASPIGARDAAHETQKHVQILLPISNWADGHLADVKRLREIDGWIWRILFSIISGAVLAAGTVFLLAHSRLAGLGAALAGGYSAFLIYKQIRFQTYSDRVLKSFPNAVDGLIRCLKAGFDLNRSLTIVSDELPHELQYEFKMMIRNRNLGQSLGDAMYFLASRLRSREALFLATLIAVQERTGGPLVTALESLSQILKDRERLRQKRLIASAEARMSALILGGLPVAVAVLLFSTNPSYREILLQTQTGRAALILGLALLTIGSFVMHRMIRMPSA